MDHEADNGGDLEVDHESDESHKLVIGAAIRGICVIRGQTNSVSRLEPRECGSGRDPRVLMTGSLTNRWDVGVD